MTTRGSSTDKRDKESPGSSTNIRDMDRQLSDAPHRYVKGFTNCHYCGAAFEVLSGPEPLFCSTDCRRASEFYRRRRERTNRRGSIICPECGEAFAPKRSDAVTCSPACRKRRQRNPDPQPPVHVTSTRRPATRYAPPA